MMDKTLTLPYYENDLLQAAALPFVGTTAAKGTLAAVFLLPKSAENFPAMYDELPHAFTSWLTALKSQLVSLKLPKFTIDTRFDLSAPLKTLGLEEAFGPEANFSGIDGLRDLHVDKVVHQAFFDLHENGVTAAAATAAMMNRTSLPPDHSSAVSMILDHPFLFFIVDLKSQEILFMGKVVNPK
jgi:serpin B